MRRRSPFVLLLAAAVFGGPACASADLVVVHRDTGRITWFNSRAEPLHVAAYSLESPSGGLLPATWLSISENYDADSGGGVDPIYVWNEFARTPFNFAEATIGAAVIPRGGTIDLGTAWKPGHTEDLTFEYLDTYLDLVLPGTTKFVDSLPGDYNGNGIVEQADLDLVLLNWGQSAVPTPQGWISDLPLGRVDQQELDGVLLNWGAPGGRTAPSAAMLQTAARVPEPHAWWLAVLVAVLTGVWATIAGSRSTRRGYG